ncbi:hypothetical protein R84B8_02326 [Treponema sp. R8-4-B8]
MTNIFYENIIIPMKISGNIILDGDNLILIYSGLGSISDKGRKHLKNIAQSLIAIQNRPGTPVPDSIGREIMRDSMKDLLMEVK